MRSQLLGLALVVCLLAWGCGGDGAGESASTTTALVTATSTLTSPTTSVVPTTAGELAGGGSGGSGSGRPVGVISSRLALGQFHGCVLVGGSVRCWGGSDDGKLGIGEVSAIAVVDFGLSVVGISDAVSVVAGDSHSCVLHSDGGVSCWGDNATGQLGDGSDVEFSSVPVRVEAVGDVVAVAAGGGSAYGHSCAVHYGGGVWCWGNNADGQLGNGESGSGVFSSSPHWVSGIDDAVDVSVGDNRTCVLRDEGLVSCWGKATKMFEDDHQLADVSAVPMEVAGVSGAVGLSVGRSYACAVLESGEVMCWGENYIGQLGDGTQDDSYVPVMVVGIQDAVSVGAGDRHVCVVHSNGEVSCWGWNLFGALGSPPEVLSGSFRFGSSLPVKAIGISDAIEVGASFGHSCVLHSDGSVSCWGSNLFGELGRYPRGEASLVSGIDNVKEVSANKYYSCALHNTGSVSCWGQNNRGQLGNGTRQNAVTPTEVPGIDDGVAILTENFFRNNGYTCVLRDSGNISCWGFNSHGNLGNGQNSDGLNDDSADSLEPIEILGLSDIVDFDISWLHACAVHEDGKVSCWGANGYGQLGNGQSSEDESGSDADSNIPVGVIGIQDAIKIQLGAIHSCALHSDGRVSCWGSDSLGELGNGENPADVSDEEALSAVPVEVVGISDAVGLIASRSSTCAILADTTLSCWGWNHRGQLGVGSDDEYLDVPTKVTGITGVASIASSADESEGESKCALLETGEVHCWGANAYGKLGSGDIIWSAYDTSYDSAYPLKVPGISEAIAITAGNDYYCVLISDGSVWCWGNNVLRQLGTYDAQDWMGASAEPVQVPNVSDATSINSTQSHACAVIADGNVKCWGYNLLGQLGNGRADYLPQKVPGLNVSG